MMPEMLRAALNYAEMGFSVFPLAEGSKKPLSGSAGVHDATLDDETIYEWWSENPMCNIGIAMGNGFVALDFDEDDRKDKHGLESLRIWEAEHGVRLPDTVTSLTPRGGTHYIYRNLQGYTCKNRVDLYNGVDVRGEGGYIVAPPSIVDGKRYLWEYAPDEVSMEFIDDAVLEFLRGDPEAAAPASFKMEDRIEQGNRTFSLIRLIGWMKCKGLSDDAIRAAVEIENEKRCFPPLTDRELDREIFPALGRGWEASSPFWNLKEGDAELWWMQRKIELLERKIQLLTEN